MDINAVLAVIVGLITTLGGWWVGRHERKATTRTSELDNVANALKHYRDMFDDVSQKWKDATAEVDKINELYRIAIDELEDLKIKFNGLANENRKLIESLKRYKNKTENGPI